MTSQAIHHLRGLAVAGMTLLAVACTSAGGVTRQAAYSGTRYEVCIAAQSAVKDLGGRIITANCEAGTIIGRLDVEGATVQLDVALELTPATRATALFDLSVHTSLVGVQEPGERWLEQLGRIADDYLKLVRKRIGRR